MFDGERAFTDMLSKYIRDKISEQKAALARAMKCTFRDDSATSDNRCDECRRLQAGGDAKVETCVQGVCHIMCFISRVSRARRTSCWHPTHARVLKDGDGVWM